MSQSQHSFLWIEIMMGYATTGGWTDPPPSAGAVGVGFDATYDVVNTLTSGGVKEL
jgi:hypothetical protein